MNIQTDRTAEDAAIRDPRFDPQPGDRLHDGAKTREVLCRLGDRVSWQTSGRWVSSRSLGSWMTWAANCRVLPANDVPGGCGAYRPHMTPDRNPADMPAVGDVLEGTGGERTVVLRHAGQVTFVLHGELKTVTTKEWRRWATRARTSILAFDTSPVPKSPTTPLDAVRGQEQASCGMLAETRAETSLDDDIHIDASTIAMRHEPEPQPFADILVGTLVDATLDGRRVGPYLVVGVRREGNGTQLKVCRPDITCPMCGGKPPNLGTGYISGAVFGPSTICAVMA